ncbi:MAG: hypothetical protein WEF53_10705 [Bacteroidota bacterium]
MKRILFVMMATLTASAFSQLIPLKTVPLATGQQFLFHPAENGTIGGITLALDDSLADPYHNPATGATLNGIRVFTSPLYYGIGLNRGQSGGSSGLTFPLGMSFRTGNFFGGMTWARQNISLDESHPPTFGLHNFLPPNFSQPTRDNANTYTFGMFGFAIPGTAYSVGVSAQWADLNAIDGVQYLYSNAYDLIQKGTITEYRLGLHGAWEGGRVLDLLVAHQSTDMEHGRPNVIFYPWDGMPYMPNPRYTIEHDQSHGFAFEASYREPVTATLNAGVIMVLDLKTYPKIPNYQLMNIPRDPGDSHAWNFGFGLANNNGKSILGFDVIYEPAFSETWAEADGSQRFPDGRMIMLGDRTVTNTFDFYNHVVRVGLRSVVRDIGIGVSFHRFKYYMRQANHILGTSRRQKEQWTEVTLSLGFGFDVFGGHVKYLGLFTTGAGRPGVTTPWNGGPRTTLLDTASFMVAPSGQLSLDEAWTGVHQISFVIQLP